MKGSLQKPGTIYLILLGIMVLGTALRLYHLNFQSLWYDEVHSIIPTAPENSVSSIVEYCKTDQPPAFFLFLHFFFHLFGYNEFIGRLAAALLGIAGIPVMYFLGCEIRGKYAGLFAALLTSLNYMHIYYSQELRFYSMAFLFTALSFLFLIRAFRRKKVVDFLLYVFFTTALLYTHYYGLVIYAVEIAVFLALLIFERDRKFVFGAILSGVLILVLFIPWLPVISSDLQTSSFWIRMPESTFITDYYYYYFGKDLFVTVVFTILIGLFLRPYFGRIEMTTDLKSVDIILIIWLVFSYLIPYVKSITGPPMLFLRYTIVSLPAWLLIISIGWNQIKSDRWRYGLAIAVSVSMFLNLVFIRKHYVKISKQQLREVSELVMERNKPSYPVYSKYSWHFNYYLKGPTESVDLGVADLSKVNMFWLLQIEFFSPEDKAEIINSMDGQFEIIERYPFYKTEALLMKRVR